MIAVSHPGRIGDALYALPATRALCQKHNCVADFFTSDWCLPLTDLLEYQDCIRKVIVPPEYKIREHSIGIQPWLMPIPPGYDAVYQLGYKSFPTEFLADWICRDAGVGIQPLKLEYPCPDRDLRDSIAVCSRTMNEFGHYFYKSPGFFNNLASKCKLIVVGIDKLRDAIPGVEDLSGNKNLLEMASIIASAKGFIGQGSTAHTIATFIPHLKRAVLTLPFTDMRHLYHSPNDKFFPCPVIEVNQVLDWLL